MADAGTTSGTGSRKRPEIQALRALAVALVVVYHLVPQVLQGGYIGVDVFLVISGYLILSHLSRELIDTGRLAVGRFYARRIRRLLPASLLVLLVTALASWLYLPRTMWIEAGRQIAGSAFYVENWLLAGNATDYSASAADSSPVQHYWSLSVEEQFYLVTPIVLLLAVLVARRFSARAVLTATVAAVTVASFVVSVVATAYDPSAAYFLLPVRIWEFGLGGLAWLLLDGRAIPRALRVGLFWVGLVAIVAPALTFSAATPFPGSAALTPVLGTAAVLVAGDAASVRPARWIVNWRPVQYLGDISYSLYLWHWPLIVIVPFALSAPMSVPLRIWILAASLVLAALSRRYVEDRFRRAAPAAFAGAPVRRVFVTMGVAMVVVAIPAATLSVSASAQVAAQTISYDNGKAQLPAGAAAALTATPTGAVFPPALVASADGLDTDAAGTECEDGIGPFTSLVTCTFGDTSPTPSKRVALVGDSHAAQWLPAIARIATREGWALTTYLRAGCPLSDVYTTRAGDNGGACIAWVHATQAALAKAAFDTVFVSTFSATGWATPDGAAGASAGMAAAWAPLERAGTAVVAIRDDPLPQQAGVKDVPSCVDRHPDDLGACTVERSAALVVDPQVLAVRDAPGVTLVDLSDRSCTATACPAVIGGVLVYRDGHHLTASFVRTLEPYLSAALGLPAR